MFWEGLFIFHNSFSIFAPPPMVIGGRSLNKKQKPVRGVAQPGSVLAWGARGREFKSRHPDKKRVMNYEL